MQIYSSNDLYNKRVQDQVSEAHSNKLISRDSYIQILSTHTTSLYTPNYFIRIALAVLTIVAITFSSLLLAMIFQMSEVPMLIFFALAGYSALEFLVARKVYYNAGVDNVLMLFTAGSLASAFGASHYPGQDIVICGVAMLAFLYLSIRFTDAFMAVLGYLAFLAFAFLLYGRLGVFAKSTAPFMLMLLSTLVYFSTVKLMENEKLWLYKKCFAWIKQLTLVTLYAAANFFGKELINEVLDLNLTSKKLSPLDWIHWTLTVVIPFVYLAYGIKKRDLMFIRTGLLLAATTALTIRYFFALMPAEIAMLAAGFLLTVISYVLIKYLKTSKGGFSFEKRPDSRRERVDIESLIISQVSGPKVAPDAAVEFGGGSFGSGGAGGNY